MTISTLGIAIALVMLALPLLVLYRFRAGILMPMLRSVVRMLVQLVLVAMYLFFLFEWDNIYVNLAWMLIMTAVAALTTVSRARLLRRKMLLSVSTGLLVSLVVTTLLLMVAFGIKNPLATRFFVPAVALLLAGMAEMNATALNTFFQTAAENQQQYYYLLGNGATRLEAVTPFIGKALSSAFAPLPARFALLAVMTFPFFLSGLLLAGVDALEAMKTLFLFVCATFFASTLATLTTLFVASGNVFDAYNHMDNPLAN